jgi:WD40 repeat protein
MTEVKQHKLMQTKMRQCMLYEDKLIAAVLAMLKYDPKKRLTAETLLILFNPTKYNIIALHQHGQLSLLDTNTHGIARLTLYTRTPITDFLPICNGVVVSHRNDGNLQVWDLYQQRLLTTMKGDSIGYSTLDRISDTMIVSGGFDCTVRIWDINTCICIHHMKGHKDVIKRVIYLDGNIVCSCSDDNTICTWDIVTGSNKLVIDCAVKVMILLK